MALHEIKTADQVIGILLGMQLEEFDKLCLILIFHKGIKIIRNQIECKKEIKEGLVKLGRI